MGRSDVIAMERPNWRSPESEAQRRASIRDYAGRLRDGRNGNITAADVLSVLTPTWNTKRETARKVTGRVVTQGNCCNRVAQQ